MLNVQKYPFVRWRKNSLISYWQVEVEKRKNIIKLLLLFLLKKAGRERFTPYQSKDPSLTIPTYRKKDERAFMPIKKHWQCLKPGSPTKSNTESARSLTETREGNKSLGGSYEYRWANNAQRVIRCAFANTPTHTLQVEHHKEGTLDCTWSYTAYIILSQIDDE